MKQRSDARRPHFGAGTLLALGGAALLAASGWMGRAQPGVDAGQVAFEADAHGHMRRVNAPPAQARLRRAALPQNPATGATGSLPPLWKPEPAWLLQQSTRLPLTRVQQIQIGALQADWLQVKASLEREMGGVTDQAAAAAGSAEPGRAVPLAMLRQGMVAYSELSREYDARRAGYWTQALSVLTVEQHRQLGALEAGVDGRGSGS